MAQAPRFGIQFAGQSREREWTEARDAIVRIGQVAEDLGYDSLSVSEHHFSADGMVPAPMVTLGALAAVTDEIRLTTGIVPLPLHHPVGVAERAAELDAISDGRFRLGVGLGWRDADFRAYGVEKSKRVPHMVEGLRALRALFSGGEATVDGDIYPLDGVELTPAPGEIPIWYGCQSEPGIRRAARLADGWLMSNTEHVHDLAEDREVYEEARSEHGRESGYLPLRRDVYVAPDDATAWEEAGPALANNYADFFGDYDDVGHSFDRGGDAVDAIREHGEGRFIVGSPETVVDEIERYCEVLDPDEFLLQMHFAGLGWERAERSVRLFGREVLPRVR